MALLRRLDSQSTQRAAAAAASVAVHFALIFIIVFSGGERDGVDSGDVPTTQLVLIEAREADRRDGLELPPIEPTAAVIELEEPLPAEFELPAPAANAELAPEVAQLELVAPDAAAPSIEPIVPELTQPETLAASSVEKAALSHRLEKLAEQLAESAQTQAVWEENGRQYSAVLTLERANDGASLDRVIAQVSAADRGRKFTTRIDLKRLAFSNFTQMVDRWDPMVQLHDDEIIGRFHSNGQFNLAYDSRTAPKFLGKVTTAARDFHTDSIGRRRHSDIFKGGIETRTSRIPLPEELAPFEWAPREANARVHELSRDTRIRFYADGGYTWRAYDAATTGYVNERSNRPVYFIARGGVTLYVQGVVTGRVLVYSPHRIVIEGNLTYANDPRSGASPDYLGLVCDRYIEVAPPGVTGPGDLELHAALFAGRRFVVTNINHRRPATLRIYGSLAAGSLSASEPRYATRIEYDSRFEEHRPPGFPSTNRFEVANWSGEWTEVSEQFVDDAL